jgi:outer membrane immunogenic protein
MKRVLAGGVALAVLCGVAHASDLPIKTTPPATAPSYDWTGFYLGGFTGNSIDHATAGTPPPGLPGGTHPGSVGVDGAAFGGGITAGYNLQVAPAWLIGAEGDFGYLGGGRLFGEWGDAIAVGVHPKWYGTVRARVGYVTGPSLLYVTGGVGFVNVTDTFGGNFATGLAPTQSTTTTVGGTFGAGIETKISRNWSNKTEYLYIDGGRDHSFASNSLGIVGTPTDFSHNYQVIRSGLNYRFNGDWEPLPFPTGPVLSSNHDWNGFYAGGNAGVGTSLTEAQSASSPGGDNDLTGTGFTGGGQAGYNYILWEKYLVGVEGDIGALGIRHQIDDWNNTSFATFSQKTDWYGTARVRVGSTSGPALMYVTGGVAWVNVQDGFAPQPAGGITGQLVTRTASGLTFGGGVEVALDSKWSAKLESLYINAGNSANLQAAPAPFFATFKDQFVVVRAGLNYKLN